MFSKDIIEARTTTTADIQGPATLGFFKERKRMLVLTHTIDLIESIIQPFLGDKVICRCNRSVFHVYAYLEMTGVARLYA